MHAQDFLTGGGDESGSCKEELENCAGCLEVTRMLNILYQTREEEKSPGVELLMD